MITKTQNMTQAATKLLPKYLPLKRGDTIEGKIISKSRRQLWLDIEGRGIGMVPPRELVADLDEVKVGDKILAVVLEPEDVDGNFILSLRRADRDRIWYNLEQKFESDESLTTRVVEANRGGLMLEVGGVRGFLPVSQLSPEHYPRVEGGDKDKILTKLNDLVGKNLEVKVISLDKNINKLIFSEKKVILKKQLEKIEKFKIGEKIKGEVSGVVDFGIFIKFPIDNENEMVEGLIHISEISWEKVDDIKKLYKIGDKVLAEIISIEDGKISLSIKRLLPDPWLKLIKQYQVDQQVEGEVTRVTPFGAFVRLQDNIEGLVHISELSDQHVSDPREVLKTGEKRDFQIISIEPDVHRLGLSLKRVIQKPTPKIPKAKSIKKVTKKATKIFKKVLKKTKNK